MIKAEMARLLAACAVLDVRMSRKNQEDQVAMVQGWFAVIDEAVTFQFALDVVKNHYANSVETVMPAIINQAWRKEAKHAAEAQRMKELVAETESARSTATPIPEALRAELESLGIRRKN